MAKGPKPRTWSWAREQWKLPVSDVVAARRAGGRRRRNAEQQLARVVRRYRVEQNIVSTWPKLMTDRGWQAYTARTLGVDRATICRDVDVILETGEITAVVTITDEAVTQLETENANVAKAISQAEVKRLPQIGRDPYELARLTPGIFGDAGRSANGQLPRPAERRVRHRSGRFQQLDLPTGKPTANQCERTTHLCEQLPDRRREC